MQGCRNSPPVPLRGRKVQSDDRSHWHFPAQYRLLSPCYFQSPCQSHPVHEDGQHRYKQTRVYHTYRYQVGGCQQEAASVHDCGRLQNHVL